MTCPRCESKQTDDVKFCTVCGANLAALRQVMENREPGKKFDWGDTWVADMFMSGDAAQRRQLEMERRLGITPEVKRYNEIKTGVILSSIGLALMIFLYIFMKGIANNADRDAAEILTRIWVSGMIPFFIGVAFMINGAFISKRMIKEMNRSAAPADPNQLKGEANPRSLRPADTNEFISTGFSVTEGTTRHLSETQNKH